MKKEIVPRHTAESMAKAYQTACSLLKNAFENIEKADELLSTAYNYKYGFLPYNLKKYRYEESTAQIKQTCWTRIVSLLELPQIISRQKKQELQAQIEKGDTPEITAENILQFCMGIYSNLPNYVNETIDEVARWLQPGPFDKYKTNEKSRYEIKEKVIKTWVFDTSWGMIRLTASSEQMFTEMDNIFHMLDGKGIVKYPKNLVTLIEEAIRQKKQEVTTEYFHIKWFKNGNAHIAFLRKDLLAEFNRRQGKGKIKGK